MTESAATGPVAIEITDDNLPVLSVVATKAMAMVDNEETSAQDLEDLIVHDPSLTTAILRVANSALYAARDTITSVKLAVARLGMVELKRTVLVAAAGQVFPRNDVLAQQFWKHAIATGFMSTMLSKESGIDSKDDAFINGMLHDIGKVVIYTQKPAIYGALVNQALQDQRRFYQHEQERLARCSHELVGARLARKWGLDEKTISAIQYHHAIEEENASDIDGDAGNTTALVSVANLYVNQLGFGTQDAALFDPLNSVPADILGLKDSMAGMRQDVIMKKLTIQMDSLV